MTFVVVADLIQPLAVGDGEVENGRASLTRFPGERGLADPDLPPVQGKPDRPDLSAREDRGYFYGFIDLDRHEDQYSEHLFTCQGAENSGGDGSMFYRAEVKRMTGKNSYGARRRTKADLFIYR